MKKTSFTVTNSTKRQEWRLLASLITWKLKNGRMFWNARLRDAFNVSETVLRAKTFSQGGALKYYLNQQRRANQRKSSISATSHSSYLRRYILQTRCLRKLSFNLQTNLTTFEIWAQWLGLQEVLLVQTSASARKNVRVRWLSHWSLTLISANPKCEKRCSRTTKEVEQACSVAALQPGIQIWSDRETRETLPLPCQLILKIWKSRHKWQVQRRVRVAIIRTSFSWLKTPKRVTSLLRWR